MQRLVNVSNRLPFPGSNSAPGGLATGVLAAMRTRGGLWFGLAAQDSADPGVLILSDRTGAACELTDALIVNPYDTNAVTTAVQAAISMSLVERRVRHERLMVTLRRNDIHTWLSRFVELLARTQARVAQPTMQQAAPIQLVVDRYKNARSELFNNGTAEITN